MYGLAEMHRAEIASASLIASGGCLATASILGLAPLACAGLARPGDAGRHRSEGRVRRRAAPSRVKRRITPTAAARSARMRRRATAIPRRSSRSSISAARDRVAFSATAVEAVRGVLITAHAFLSGDHDDRDLWHLYRSRYADEPFVRIVKSRSGLHRSPSPSC